MRSLAVTLAALAGTLAAAQTTLDLWPHPQQVLVADPSTSVSFAPGFTAKCVGLCPAPLPQAIGRYTNKLFFAAGTATGTKHALTLDSCSISVDAEAPLTTNVRWQRVVRRCSALGTRRARPPPLAE